MDVAHLEELADALMAARCGVASPDQRARIAVARTRATDDHPATLLGAAHEATLSDGARRRGGVHYTARALAERVAGEAVAALAPERGVPRVLDPAMGAGAFLCAALDAIHARAGLPNTPDARRALAREAAHGVDRDPAAVLAARRTLWVWVGDPTLDRAAFDTQLVCADALFSETPLLTRPYELVVGNPPFLGGKRVRTELGEAYAAALGRLHAGANKNTDLAAHFLRLGFRRLAPGGVLGFVTTNSIAQGDTREGGLAAVVREGGTIVAAERRVKWPGRAGVVVSLIWLKRGPHAGARRLDGEAVPHIDVFLSRHGRASDPPRREANRGRAFIGCFLRGKGFVLDPTTPEGAARCAAVDAILAREPGSAELVRPFLGGDEVLRDPEHRAHRRVVHMGARSLEEARAHRGLFAFLQREVRPFREARQSTAIDRQHAAHWWRFANPRPELEAATRGLRRVIALPRVTGHVTAVWLPRGTVCSDQLVVVASASPAVLALLASRVHAAWAHQFASTLGDGLRYTPSDVFETLPLPAPTFEALEEDPTLLAAGEGFVTARAEVLRTTGEGLTAWLGRLARGERGPATEALLAAHVALDRAVLSAYGLDPAWATSTPATRASGARPPRWGFAEEVERRVVAALLAHEPTPPQAARADAVG